MGRDTAQLGFADYTRNRANSRFSDWLRDSAEALHVAPEFAGQVARLRDQLDGLGPSLPASRQQEVAAAFRTTFVLEIDFHDAPNLEEPDD